ncbi:MAG: NAD-glutamate dehydrogenase [Hyphomicrobiales bacterium]|nr:NAD-glutamate dehydrogenase [Hyphomicrobiales bacterium]
MAASQLSSRIPRERVALIERIVRAARGLKGAVDAALLRSYFRGVGEEDLASRKPQSLARLAQLHQQFAAGRRRGETRVRVFSPDAALQIGERSSYVLVVTDDRPFLVDSLSLAFSNAGIGVQLLIHPVLERPHGREGVLRESWQLYEIDRQADPRRLQTLEATLRATLEDVRVAVEDWRAMRTKMLAVVEALGRSRSGACEEEIALLRWVEAAHFVFLGYRYNALQRGPGHDRLLPAQRSGLGILRDGHAPAPIPEQLVGAWREAMRGKDPLLISKSARVSTVHRGGHLDHLAIKDFDLRGRVRGEHRFLGLWTSTAYFASPAEIPMVRRKVDAVVAQFGLDPQSHDGKAVLAVLETWPRDELFQSSVDELVAFVRGVVNLYERRTTRLMMRHDAPGRFWSCMAFVPRDRYTTEVRLRIEQVLLARCGGSELESQVQIAGSNHARLHVTVRGAGLHGRLDVAGIETEVAAAVATWTDNLRSTLLDTLPASRAITLFERHAARFPLAYQSEVAPAAAVPDMEALEELAAAPQALHLRLHRPPGAARHVIHLRVARHGAALPIADLLPVMENFGLRMLAERPWTLAPIGGQLAAHTAAHTAAHIAANAAAHPGNPQAAAVPAVVSNIAAAESAVVSLQDFALELRQGAALDVARDDERLLAALRLVRDGSLENDGFNRLVLLAGLEAHEVNVLRACCRYLLQAGSSFSQSYMERTLAAHPAIAADLHALFVERLAPLKARKSAKGHDGERLQEKILRRLDAIASADEDRILRAFLALILAIERTNHFQRDANGARRPTLALKLDPQAIPGLPLPRPKHEIYVFGPQVEGVHLRMGGVARGGLRWSDRREDFRTEVLGLMKAQNVKNTLIVPEGAKGGFVPRRLPTGGNREAIQAEGVAAYRLYINALLDVTDNLAGRRVLPPVGVRRRDGDDPYLVVAADKGTATFSDTANGISVARGFWLGDAFASGGSAGYDHKKMGITARGAWECVKRHFRELGVDIQTQRFTVAGIGDMSGDVFGNGMLLSPQIRLVAAFNHAHVFIDPDPDPATSLAERTRLFALPRSGWNDYDRKLLSRGGAVFERSAKSLRLSAEARALLDLDTDTLTPTELIRAILRMRVDLLWNGGIGTYVKAATEPQSAAGDRGNDALRVDGRELRARVVGEGGNLGFTQRGRVEYALAGGRINTDFIDNSAGVNTSDVEVNLKILTNGVEAAGRLKRRDRDRLLARLTDEVAALVLRNNYLQSQALSTLELQSAERLPELREVIRELERGGELDRAVEFLPDEETLTARRKQGLGLTRPELAIVLAYAKISLNRQLLASELPEDRYFAAELERYFPAAVRRRFARDIARHKLRREIITTAVTNSLVNRMGPSFVMRARAESGASADEVARAYSIAREILRMRELWVTIESLDNRVAARVQYVALADTARLLRHLTLWLLRQRRGSLDVARSVKELATPMAQLRDALPAALAGSAAVRYRAAEAEHAAAGLPPALASNLAELRVLDNALDVLESASQSRSRVAETAKLWFAAAAALRLDWLADSITGLAVDSSLQAAARTGLRESARVVERRIFERIRASGGLEPWRASRTTALAHWERVVAEIATQGAPDFASLSVCLDALRPLAD